MLACVPQGRQARLMQPAMPTRARCHVHAIKFLAGAAPMCPTSWCFFRPLWPDLLPLLHPACSPLASHPILLLPGAAGWVWPVSSFMKLGTNSGAFTLGMKTGALTFNVDMLVAIVDTFSSAAASQQSGALVLSDMWINGRAPRRGTGDEADVGEGIT